MSDSEVNSSRTMNVSEARRQFSEILNAVHRDDSRIVVEKNGIPVAAIVPIWANDLAARHEESREKLLQILTRTSAGFQDVSEEELEREIERADASIKRERLLARRIVRAIRREGIDAFDVSDDALQEMIVSALAEETIRKAVAEDQVEGYRT
jgi:prevent-host-death family protein